MGLWENENMRKWEHGNLIGCGIEHGNVGVTQTFARGFIFSCMCKAST